MLASIIPMSQMIGYLPCIKFRRVTYSTKKAGTHLVYGFRQNTTDLYYDLTTLKYHLIPAISTPFFAADEAPLLAAILPISKKFTLSFAIGKLPQTPYIAAFTGF